MNYALTEDAVKYLCDKVCDNGSNLEVANLLDLIFHIGYVIPTTNPNFDPNKMYPWQTWERFAQGKTLVGVDESDVDFASVMLEGGAKTHTLTVAQIPSHNHSGYVKITGGKLASGSTYSRLNDNGGNSQDLVIDNTGGGEAHNNLQPYVTVYYWRRISGSTDETLTATHDGAGNVTVYGITATHDGVGNVRII